MAEYNYRKPNEPLFGLDQFPSFKSTDVQTNELEFYSKIVSEGYALVYPKVPIFMIDRDKTVVDPYLGEAETKIWKSVVYIPGQVTWNPKVHDLNFFGIEDSQEVIISFSSMDLLNLEIDLEDLSGAVALLANEKNGSMEEFRIRTIYQRPEDAISWHGGILDIAVTLDIHQQSSLTDSSIPLHEVSIPESAFLFSREEYKFYSEMLLEGYHKTLPPIPILPLDRTATIVDPYLQEADIRVFKDPVYVPGHVQWSPPYFSLGKFGIETEQEVLITFSDLALKDAGFEDLDELIGSLVILKLDQTGNRREYEILSIHKEPVNAFSPFGDVLNIAFVVNIWEQDSLTTENDTPADLDYPI